jgi:hypothetical protein
MSSLILSEQLGKQPAELKRELKKEFRGVQRGA